MNEILRYIRTLDDISEVHCVLLAMRRRFEPYVSIFQVLPKGNEKHTVSKFFTFYPKLIILVRIKANKPGTHESAPYLRLKNSKKTSKCQVFSLTVPEKLKSWTDMARRGCLARTPGVLNGHPLGFFNNHFVA